MSIIESRHRGRPLTDWFPAEPGVGDWARLIGGGLLTLYGLRRGSLTGMVLAGLGGRMLYKVLSPELHHVAAPLVRSPAPRFEQPGPTVLGDPVAEASWESFPASDPPGTY